MIPYMRSIIVCLIIIAGGSGYGLYGKYYLKPAGKAVLNQMQANRLVEECIVLLNRSNPIEIKTYLKKLDVNRKSIDKYDAVITGLSLVSDKGKNTPTDIGSPLRECENHLKSKIEHLNFN